MSLVLLNLYSFLPSASELKLKKKKKNQIDFFLWSIHKNSKSKTSINCVKICSRPTHEEGPSIQPYVSYFTRRHNKTRLSTSTTLQEILVSCCCSCHFYRGFLCELTEKHGSTASLEMLNLDTGKTNNICLLSKTSRTAATVETSHVQPERGREAPPSHCNPQYEEVLENPCNAYFA